MSPKKIDLAIDLSSYIMPTNDMIEDLVIVLFKKEMSKYYQPEQISHVDGSVDWVTVWLKSGKILDFRTTNQWRSNDGQKLNLEMALENKQVPASQMAYIVS